MTPELLAELTKHGMRQAENKALTYCKEGIEAIQTNAVLATLVLCEEIAKERESWVAPPHLRKEWGDGYLRAATQITEAIKSKRLQIERDNK